MLPFLMKQNNILKIKKLQYYEREILNFRSYAGNKEAGSSFCVIKYFEVH